MNSMNILDVVREKMEAGNFAEAREELDEVRGRINPNHPKWGDTERMRKEIRVAHRASRAKCSCGKHTEFPDRGDGQIVVCKACMDGIRRGAEAPPEKTVIIHMEEKETKALVMYKVKVTDALVMKVVSATEVKKVAGVAFHAGAKSILVNCDKKVYRLTNGGGKYARREMSKGEIEQHPWLREMKKVRNSR
jgi:hypothetical protein